MPELVVLLVRAGVLALLWLFVLAAVRVIRTDLAAAPSPVAGRARDVRRRAPKKNRRSQARTLVVVEGQLSGTTVTLDDSPVTVGRGDSNTLVLDDDYASTAHARLSPGDGAWLLEDLGSTNGTWLGREKVTEPTPVPLGTAVRVGRTVLELRR